MKSMYEKSLLVYTTALLALALNVQAQQLEQPNKSTQSADTSKQQMETPGSKGIPEFSEVDVNQDGVITKAEAEAGAMWLANNFQQFDLNLDGYINESEYDEARG